MQRDRSVSRGIIKRIRAKSRILVHIDKIVLTIERKLYARRGLCDLIVDVIVHLLERIGPHVFFRISDRSRRRFYNTGIAACECGYQKEQGYVMKLLYHGLILSPKRKVTEGVKSDDEAVFCCTNATGRSL